jgi:hypothetical protein
MRFLNKLRELAQLVVRSSAMGKDKHPKKHGKEPEPEPPKKHVDKGHEPKKYAGPVHEPKKHKEKQPVVEHKPIVAKGTGTSEGGFRPDPPMDEFPLLVWVSGEARLEDGRASVEEVAVAAATNPHLDAVAAQFGTTTDHVAQAVAYAGKTLKKS